MKKLLITPRIICCFILTLFGCKSKNDSRQSSVPLRCYASHVEQGVIITIENVSGCALMLEVGGFPGAFSTDVDLKSTDSDISVLPRRYRGFQARWIAILGTEGPSSLLRFGLVAPGIEEKSFTADVSAFYSRIDGMSSPTNFVRYSTNITIESSSGRTPLSLNVREIAWLDPLQ